MNRLLREERGSVFVLAAVLIPIVFMVLAGLTVDVGTWYTHKRQLQNRADAGALAAGVQYTANWAACGSALKAQAAGLIDASARQYAGDPQQGGSVYNTEVTEQTRINVEINSNVPDGKVNPDTSWNDTGGSNLGPCDEQAGDVFSPVVNGKHPYYVDVGVRERDQRSLFGMFGVDLLRNEAHARVALLTAAAGNGFLPIALPDQDIRQAEIRYYQYCSSNNNTTQPMPKLLATVPLKALGSAYQTQVAQGTTLWGPTVSPQDLTPTGVTLTIPRDGDCSPGTNSIYMPVRAQVRIAGVDQNVLDIDSYTCAQLVTMAYADCWDQVSDFSVDGDNPRSQPWFHEVTLTGGQSAGQCAPDAYFAKPADPTATSCTFAVSVRVDWNGLTTNPPAGRTFTVNVGGNLTPPAPNVWNGVWTGSSSNTTFDQNTVRLSWTCTEPDTSTSNPNDTRSCGGATGIPVHSTFLGNRANSSIVKLVRTSLNPQASGGQPGSELHWYPAPQGNGNNTITVYPTLGLEGSLYVGKREVLRAPHCSSGNNDSNDCTLEANSPKNSQSIDCEPGGGQGGQGHDFVMFANGCQPWYAPNDYSSDWWTGTPAACPPKPNGSSPNLTPPWDPNNQGRPRECVVKAPGFSPNVISDGIAAAIGNCSNINNNSCQRYACTNLNYYDPSTPNEWALEPGVQTPPRVVFLFIVPYGAYKDSASQGVLPILNFAAFYVTGWQGKGNGANANPCQNIPDPPGPARPDDPNMQGGDISGYFVSYTLPNAPGDPNNYCQVGQLRPCVPVLVR